MFDKIDKLKAVIDKQRPFDGTMLEQLKAYYRIGLTYSSNALEGNTLTISETKILLEDGLTIGGKPLKYTYEAIGHAKAFDFMFTLLKSKGISETAILTMHKLFYNQIDNANAGVYRNQAVFVTGSQYAVSDAKKIASDMAALIDWVDTKRKNYHPVEFAALAILLTNAALIQDGYMLAVIPPILRPEYITLLEKAHKRQTIHTIYSQ